MQRLQLQADVSAAGNVLLQQQQSSSSSGKQAIIACGSNSSHVAEGFRVVQPM
jgi:hypothetical protein